MNIDGKVAEAVVGCIAAAVPLVENAERLEKEAQAKAKVEQEKQAAVDKAIAPVVDTLARAGYITNDQRTKAAESLKDPLKALDTLHRIALSAAVKTAEEAKALGSASTPKKDTTYKAAKVASVRGSAADQHFLDAFGL